MLCIGLKITEIYCVFMGKICAVTCLVIVGVIAIVDVAILEILTTFAGFLALMEISYVVVGF
jgi:hypothetical protein